MEDASPIPLDAETKVAERPADHEAELRLWLRLLTCTTLIEGEVRRRLRDVRRDAAALRPDGAARQGAERHDARRVVPAHDGVERQRDGLVERLVEQGLLDRRPSPNDRRAQIVSLTARAGAPSAPWRARTRTGSRQSFTRRHRDAPAPPGEDENVGPPRNRRIVAGRPEMDLAETLSWPFFDDGHRRFAEALTRWADATLPSLPHDDVTPAAARGSALGEAGLPQGGGAGGARRPASPPRRAHAMPRAGDSGCARWTSLTFAFAMQGLGTGSISLFGSPELKSAICRRCATVRRSRRLRCPSPRPARTCGAGHDGNARRQSHYAHRWDKNLDLERRHRRPLRRVRTHRRGAGRQGLSAFVVDADAPGLRVPSASR
jgi:hypothetical protein